MVVRPGYQSAGGSRLDSIIAATVVVPSDSAASDASLPIADGLYVGVTGDVAAVLSGNDNATPVVFKAVPAGSIIPMRVIRIATTGTTATNMLFLLGVNR